MAQKSTSKLKREQKKFHRASDLMCLAMSQHTFSELTGKLCQIYLFSDIYFVNLTLFTHCCKFKYV